MRRSAMVVALVALAAPAAAQQETRAFVVRLGSDTVAVERYQRRGAVLEGTQVVRTPRTMVREYRAYLRPDGSMSRLELSYRVPGAAPHARAAYDFAGDSAVVQTVVGGGEVRTVRVRAPRGSVPWMSSAIGVYEPALAAARRARGGRAELATVGNAPEPMQLSVRPLGADSVLVTTLTGVNRVAVDAAGRILGWNGLDSNFKIVAEPAGELNLDRLAAGFAARDRQGSAMGVLSPTDTVRARVGGAAITIRYGRPSRRGREIFGGILPWGQLWRTGANDATHLTTSADLEVGGVRVPAGSYTLFSIPSPEQWTLIINRQTGQSGTEYDPAHDLARIPMRRDPVPEPVEQFTIALEPDGDAAKLVLMWDDTRVWVPVEVR